MTALVPIAVLGLGEAGSEIARDLVTAGADADEMAAAAEQLLEFGIPPRIAAARDLLIELRDTQSREL